MKSRPSLTLGLAVLLGFMTGCATVGQVSDPSFNPTVASPAFGPGSGPAVCVDEAHFNFHTSSGRYLPFAELLRKDGYVVRGLSQHFGNDSLADCRVLVIANALSEADRKHWRLPSHSAFDDEEIAAAKQWVSEGGALFLIADHMPFPGAAGDLAAAFGILFSNGFAPVDANGSLTRWIFRRSDGSLADHPITRGRDASESVDEVCTFVGQAFRTEVRVTPLLTLPPDTVLLMPAVAWEFSEKTPWLPASGMFQGAVTRADRGRIAVFGEAAMFSSQVQGKDRIPMGMNAPIAAHNAQFLLNVMHWLSGLLPDE